MKNKAILLFFLFIILLQAVLSMSRKSATTDENPHLAAGYSYLKTGDFRMGRENPPLIKEIAALPLLFLNLRFPSEHPSWDNADQWEFATQLIYHNRVESDRILFWGRVPIVILSIVLGFFVFRWASELYGNYAGMLALFLYSFSPNILAHSRLANTDMGVSLFFFLSIYFFWRYLNKPNIKGLVLTGVVLGMALASKFNSIVLVPVLVVLAGIHYVQHRKDSHEQLRGLFLRLAVILLVGFAALSLCYRIVSVPDYFAGIVSQLSMIEKGHPTFLMGEYSLSGWWNYFLIAFLIKTPVPMIILTVLAAAAIVVRRRKMRRQKENPGSKEYFLIIPVVILFIVSSLSRKQLGLRYILPVYPFLFVLIGNVVVYIKTEIPDRAKRITAAVLVLLCGWYLFSSVRIFPHYLAYFNELIGGPDNGYKYLLDSNMDYGQDLKLLEEYWKKEGRPELMVFYAGSTPLPKFNPRPSVDRELIAISVNRLQGIFYARDRKFFDWLRDKEPIEKIGYTMFIYDITNDTVAHIYLGIMHAGEGSVENAIVEFGRAERIDPGLRIPDEAKARVIVGIHYTRKNLTDRAIGEYLKAIEAKEDCPDAHYNLGVAYEKKGMIEKAINEYSKEIEFNPGYCSSYKNIGILYYGKGNYEKTVYYWEEYLRLAPDASDAGLIKREMMKIK